MMEIRSIQDSKRDIYRIEELLNCGIFNQQNIRHPLQESAFIDLMICMRDLLAKCEKFSTRVDFADDVIPNAYSKDVTGAITAVRDACCHIDSYKKNFDENGNRGSFNVCYGQANFMKIGDLELTSDYPDDVAVFYGPNRIYLKRHIQRALSEAKAKLQPLFQHGVA